MRKNVRFNRFSDREFLSLVADIGLHNGAELARRLQVSRQAVSARKQALGLSTSKNQKQG